MEACWSAEPSDRPSVRDIMAHCAFKVHADNRPVEDVATVSPANLRDCERSKLDLLSTDVTVAILNEVDIGVDDISCPT